MGQFLNEANDLVTVETGIAVILKASFASDLLAVSYVYVLWIQGKQPGINEDQISDYIRELNA